MFRSYSEKVYRPGVKLKSSQSPKVQWFSCDLCNPDDEDMETFWHSETDVELHRKEVHFKDLCHQMNINPNRFCTVCMTLQNNKDSLLSHVKSRHLFSSPHAYRVEREIFICDYCSHIFFNKLLLEAHVQYIHLWRREQRKQKTFVCPKCKRTCQLKSFWYHMLKHDIPSLSVCDICLTSCPNLKELLTHLKTHPMLYKCEICCYQTSKERIFTSHLENHMATEHELDETKIKKYAKNVFITSFQKSSQMKYNIHNTIRGLVLPLGMHICILCRQICTDINEMTEHVCRDHMQSADDSDPPQYRCGCGVQFRSRVLLKHHMFKLKGNHGPVNENDSSSSQRGQPLRNTLAAEPKNSTNKQREPDWLMAPKNETNIDHAGPSNDESEILGIVGTPVDSVKTGIAETVSETGDEKDGEELVYIYAAITDDELVTLEEDCEHIIGF